MSLDLSHENPALLRVLRRRDRDSLFQNVSEELNINDLLLPQRLSQNAHINIFFPFRHKVDFCAHVAISTL